MIASLCSLCGVLFLAERSFAGSLAEKSFVCFLNAHLAYTPAHSGQVQRVLHREHEVVHLVASRTDRSRFSDVFGACRSSASSAECCNSGAACRSCSPYRSGSYCSSSLNLSADSQQRQPPEESRVVAGHLLPCEVERSDRTDSTLFNESNKLTRTGWY